MLREASPSEDPAHSALFRALQRRRLHQVLWVLALAFAVLVVMNLSTQGYLSAGFELVMTGALALALRWNARGRLTQALVLTIVALLLGLCALTAVGQGLYDEALVAFPGLLLFAGLACFLLAAVGAIVRAYRRVALERLVATGALGVVIIAAGPHLNALVLLAAVDLVIAAMLTAEHFRVEVRHRSA